jgi:hypothetical protein
VTFINMASAQVLTPPVTPANSDLSSKQTQKTRYKRIRFKTWKPEQARTQEAAPDVLHRRRQHRSPSTASSEQARDDGLSTSDVESIIRRATCRPSPLQILPVNGTRMDPFTELPIKAEGIVPATLDYCTPSLSFLADSTDLLQFSASALQLLIPDSKSKATKIRTCRCCFHLCCKMLSSSNQS